MRKKKDMSWDSHPMDVYVGHEVSSNMVYVGGKYYGSSAQVHLSIEEAKWLRKHLLLAIRRSVKESP
jgi:hypothetical protein